MAKEKGKKLPKITAKQEKFVLEYMKDFNKTRAAIRAGYGEKGAASQGCRLFNDVKISQHIDSKKEAWRKEYDSEWLKRQFEFISKCDFAKYMNVSDVMEIPEEIRSLVKSFKKRTFTDAKGNSTVSFELTFMDKDKALENIGKVLGTYSEKKEVNITGNMGDLILEARKRKSKNSTKTKTR